MEVGLLFFRRLLFLAFKVFDFFFETEDLALALLLLPFNSLLTGARTVSFILLCFNCILDCLLASLESHDLSVLLLDISHDFTLHLSFSFEFGLSLTQLSLNVICTAFDLDSDCVLLIECSILLFAHFSLTLRVLVKLHEMEFLCFEIIFKFSHCVIVKSALQLDPHLFDLSFKPILLPFTISQFLRLAAVDSFLLSLGIKSFLPFLLYSLQLCLHLLDNQ